MSPPKPELELLSSIHNRFVAKTEEIKEVPCSFIFLNLATLSTLET